MTIIQTSCSELLVDTAIYEPGEALERLSKLFEDIGWESSPPLTLEVLEMLKTESENEEFDGMEEKQDVVIYDIHGNRAKLEYGENGYITTGYRFDSQCNHGDELCYPIFHEVIKRINGELIACDGGSTGYYYDWASQGCERESAR